MANNRFVETACEIVGVQSPSEIREKELKKLLKEHFRTDRDDDFVETDAGIIYRMIFEDDDVVEERPLPFYQDNSSEESEPFISNPFEGYENV